MLVYVVMKSPDLTLPTASCGGTGKKSSTGKIRRHEKLITGFSFQTCRNVSIERWSLF
jgi:hypothetical protein